MKTAYRAAATAVLTAMVLSAIPASASSICGDVNDSGSVTASDALSVLRAAVGQAIELLCAAPQLPRTGETSVVYGAGSDGVVNAGVARSFTDNGDGTISDHATGLMWEKKDDAGGIHDQDNTYTWSTGTNKMQGTIATVFLAALNGGAGFAGYKDWRVPNQFELYSLADLGGLSPAIYAAFKFPCDIGCTTTTCSCTNAGAYYWSSTTSGSLDQASARYVYFGDGTTGSAAKTGEQRVRAVRGGL